MRTDMRSILAGAFVLLLSLSLHSQTKNNAQSSELRGDVADAAEKAPIEKCVCTCA